MERVTTIGLDLAKSVFQVHGVDADGRVVLRRKLRRGEVEAFFAALVHKSADGHGVAAIAAVQAMRRDTGMPSAVIRLSTEQATLTSAFWLGRVRAQRWRPMIPLYRDMAVSPSERLP
jgi:hypothetical protein